MMMSKNLFIQVAMIAISIGIIITFVNPTFSEIGEQQDDILVYQTEQQKVSGVNNQLSSLITSLNNVASDDYRRLLTYMPDEVDTIAVARDLSLVSRQAGVLYISAVSRGVVTNANSPDNASSQDFIQPKEHMFSLNVEGTYDTVKNLFALLEQNNYPIEVQNVNVQKKGGGLLSVEIGLSVYAYENSPADQEIVF
jgi:hypothetical protein